jgi:thiamine biosynthesis protein ThiI
MTSPTSDTLILLRLSSELSVKARGTRRRFLRRLVANIREALGGPAHVDSEWTRIFVQTSDPAAAEKVLARIPGISSFSVVIARCPANLEEIVSVGAEHFRDAVRGRTYAVRSRRSGTHSFTSNDVARALGAALNPDAKVDLDNPEIEVDVEVRDEKCYFFSGKFPGPGGLPLGVEGRAVALLSGGFDSAVAAWMMLKRGVQLDYVFCNLAGDAYERSAAQVAKVLADSWSYGTRPTFHVVDFGDLLDELRSRTQPRLWQLVLKRLMYRAADRVGRELRAQAVITGEAIGQVSSQTLANLAAIDRASTLPVFRPLIGFDKMDIIEMSRRIGTFDLSSRIKEYCSIAPGSPATNASARETEIEEAKLDLAILQRALEARRVLELRSLREADLAIGYLFTEDVPEDAILVDIRSPEEWETWHYPGSVNRAAWELMGNPRALGKDNKFVVYCDVGTQAAQVAEGMQRAGVEAYAFRGGLDVLKRRAESRVASRGSPYGA